MTEGTTAIAEEQALPASQTQAPEKEVEDNEGFLPNPDDGDEIESEEGPETEGEDETEGDEAEGGEPEAVDVEYEGKQYKIHPELKDALLRQADYTRKTQETAEVRKTAEAKLAEAEQNFTVSKEVLEARATLLNVDHQLEQYQKVDWNQLEAEDPVGAMSHWRQFQQLEKAKGDISGFLNEQQAKRTEQAEQETATRLRETAEFAKTKIPGWTPEVDAKVTNFAEAELGFTRDTLKNAYSPAVYKTLHLAWLGHQSLQKQNAKPKPATPASQPLSKVSARANPVAGLDDRLGIEEWTRLRNEKAKRP